MPNKFTTTGYDDLDHVVRDLISEKESSRFGQYTVFFLGGNVQRVERKETTTIKELQDRQMTLPG